MISIILQGGVGNNLFQVATAFAFGLKHNAEVIFPTTIENPHYEGQQVHQFTSFKYSDNIIPLPTFQEQQFHYKPLPFMDYVCLSGYFQSWRYFNQYRKELLAALDFKWEPRGGCAIHIRRGDFLDKPDVHPVITKEYLLEAMKYVVSKTNSEINFFVYSDDEKWCIETFNEPKFEDYSIVLCHVPDEYDALQKMSCCEHQITSNSSFGWWAAYLNQNSNKIVVHPKKWFGSEYRHHNTRDLYLSNSIII